MAAAQTGTSIFARARTIATQMGGDANSSAVIDALGGIRTLFNNIIRSVYRQKAKDARFLRDIVVQNAVAMVNGVGSCPPEVMREFLHMAQWKDENNSLITYYDYNIDQNSGVNYDQLGYTCLRVDDILYTEPAPGNADSYTGDLIVTTPSFPVFPISMETVIPFPSDSIVDSIVFELAAAIAGKATNLMAV